MEYRPSQPRYARLSLVTIAAALVLVATLLPSSVMAAETPPGVAARLAHPHAPDRVIVKYESGASKAKRANSVRSVDVAAVEPMSQGAADTVVLELEPDQTVADAMIEIAAQPGVVYVEPDYKVFPAATSDDTYYVNDQLWGMYGSGTSPHANQFGSAAGEAWTAGFIGSPNVYVAVVDQGIQVTHPDLAPNMWVNTGEIAGNSIDDDGNGFVDDVNGWNFLGDNGTVFEGIPDDWHGTHVAGTIGARGGNGSGVAGVNWRVRIISAKFMDEHGGFISGAVDALNYITNLKLAGLNVVATNNSWTGDGYSQTLVDAIDRAGDAGILAVSAAGNDTLDVDPLANRKYPAANQCTNGGTRGWDCILSVANLTEGGDRASLSNWGDVNVDLAAPGSDINSTYPGSTYAPSSGTSMAAPHVTGAIALCASIGPSLTAGQIRSHIINSVTPTTSMSSITVTGGRLDIGTLIGLCGGPIPAPDIVGELQADANSAITGASLTVGTVDSVYHDTVAAGLVLSQDPAAGVGLETGDPVDYLLSLGQPVVPDITDMTIGEATAALTPLTLTLGDEDQAYHDTIGVGRIISSSPIAGTVVNVNSDVDYLLSLGQPVVPDITGMTATDAIDELADVTLVPGTVTSVNHDTVPAGQVISQGTAPGMEVMVSDPVDYVLSDGPIAAPNVVGLMNTAANSAIIGVGLTVGSVNSEHHNTVAAGLVISQDPDPGTDLGSGDPVDYVLSLGRPVVPDITGHTVGAAGIDLAAAALVLGTETQAYDDIVAAGLIISSTPADGEEVDVGSAVDYVLSLGFEPVPVPDLQGLTAAAADSAISGATLVKGSVDSVHHAVAPAGTVVGQAPAAGSLVAPGTAVTYTVSLGTVRAVAPVAPVAPSTVIVDDKSSRFVRKGTGWRAARAGYAARSLWVPVRRSSVKRFALWKPVLDAPGRYRILAKVPGGATTKRAVYQIKTTGGWVKRARNQLKSRGRWVDLGVHTLASRPAVRLTDKTGELGRSRRRVAFDAMRFVPVGSFAAPSTAVTPEPVTPAVVHPSSSAASPSEQLAPTTDPATEPTPTPEPTPEPEPEPAAVADPPEQTEPEAVPEPTQAAESPPVPTTRTREPSEPSPSAVMPEPEPAQQPTTEPKVEPAATPEPRAAPTPEATPAPKPTATPEPKPEPTNEPTAGPKATAQSAAASKPTPEPGAPSEPVATPRPKPTAEAKPKPTTKAQPKPQVAEPKAKSAEAAEPNPMAEPKPKTEPKPKAAPKPKPKAGQAKVEPKPKPMPKPTPEPVPESVLVVDSAELELTSGQTKALGAYLCEVGSSGPGADGQLATSDDTCEPAKAVEWNVKDPAVASLERPAEMQPHRTFLTPIAPAASTQIVATVHDLKASVKLTVVPTEPETPPEIPEG